MKYKTVCPYCLITDKLAIVIDSDSDNIGVTSLAHLDGTAHLNAPTTGVLCLACENWSTLLECIQIDECKYSWKDFLGILRF